ncbi:hypothetical protein VNI00_018913 [Paramarasmius palmivorus]|uniref:Uncharacterized protein n=1 Tax=Paramarasmius palmivorus TaxID=297713 RepID=A0AAW0ATJ6_9AGAR
MSTDLAAARNAITTVSTGHQVNEDSWMTMWCSSNWGDLLQPAPLSIALLGSIMVIAASTDDFSLVNADDPQYQWKYATHPGSFKACLMQMVSDGYTAFGTADNSMTRIQNASSQLPQDITTAISAYLPSQLQSILDLTKICVTASKNCEDGFRDIFNLSTELVVACTNQVGTTEQKLNVNNMQLQITQERQKAEEAMVASLKENTDMMKQSFQNAENNFNDAVKNVPSGWDLVGMQVVDSATQLLVSAGNAFISMATIKSQAASAGINLVQKATDKVVNNTSSTGNKSGQNNGTDNKTPVQSAQGTQDAAAALTDPGALQAQRVLTFINILQHLVIGGPNNGPDWERIRGGSMGNGGLYVKTSLEDIQGQLGGAKPLSTDLLPLVQTAITTITSIIQIAGTAQSADANALDKFKSIIDQLNTSVQQVVTKANLTLQQTGGSAKGPANATPPTPSTAQSSSNSAKLAVENAKFAVDQTRANLQAARDAYNHATAQLVQQQEEISTLIGKLTSLKLTNAGLQAMLPVLKQAVGAFSTLQAQFSQITQFFQSVASLVQDVLQPSVSSFTTTIQQTATLGGVSISAFSRNLIYNQMMLPLRVSMLSQKIAATYLDVSANYILPAQRNVGSMMQFSTDTSDAAKAALKGRLNACYTIYLLTLMSCKAKLETAQKQLQQQANDASTHIRDLVANDQKTFASSIATRLTAIETTLQPVLPEIAQPVPKVIEDVAATHVQEVTTKRAEAASENPMYDMDDLI